MWWLVQGGNSTRTAQSVHIWSVSYQVGNTDLGSSSARLYLLNDNIFFNLEDGTISVGEPEYFLTAARSGGVSLTTPGAGTFQINPTVSSKTSQMVLACTPQASLTAILH